MNHPIHRISAVEQVGVYVLRLQFEDGLSRDIDFEAILEGELFGPLRDPSVFAQVQLDSEVHTIAWPSGADFDPGQAHDWPEHEQAFRVAAENGPADAVATPVSLGKVAMLNRPPQ